MPILVQLVEIIIPPLIQAVVNHYEKKEVLNQVQQASLDAHKSALSALKIVPPQTPGPSINEVGG